MVRALRYVRAPGSRFSRVVSPVVLSLLWLVAGGFLASATQASAQDIYTVTVPTDDAAGVAANCPANGSGASCSLRDAIAAASPDPSGSTINFAVTGTITVIGTPIVISPTANLSITGPGESQLTISGGNAVTPFGIATSATVAISGLTFAQGYDAAYYNGGAMVIASGTVQVSNTAFVGNSSVSGYFGGAIYNSGNLTLSGDTFQGNSASSGGALYNGGTLAVVGCTFSGNTASYGGAIFNNSGTAQIINSTFATNSASSGGALFNNSGATLAVSDSTVVTNAASPGTSIYDSGGSLTVNNSIVTGATDCSGSGCPLNGSNGNVVGDPNVNLSALQNWGGPTQSFLPLSPSSTHCAGSSSLLPVDPTTGATLNDDQRGFPMNTACVDAGAVQTNYMTVATTNDTFNSGSSCTGAGTSCSLRDAVYLANQAGLGDINFAQGLSGTIAMSPVSAVEPTGQVNIIGPGANVLTIAGDGTDPVFVVTGQTNISGLTITGGANPGGTGGGVLDSGNLTLSNVLVTGNASAGGSGGGIWVNALPASLTLNNSTVANNSASEGGGIYASGPATINESTIADNTATDSGGGIFNNTGPMAANNMTLSGNTAGRDAGGIYQNAPFALENSVVSGNTAPSGTDIDGTVAYTASNSRISNPLATLAVLGNYGGPTPTMIPLPGSSAICAGAAALLPVGINTDQRGYANVNTTYTGSVCVDAGAVQTNYTGVAWMGATMVGGGPSTPTYYGNATSPIGPPAVTAAIVDNGVNSVPGISVNLNVTGPGTATITTNPITTAATGATFTVTPAQVGTYTAAIAPIAIYGSYSVTANPAASLVISAAGAATSTAVDPVFANLGAASATLAATITPNSGGATVNEGSVSFTVTGSGGMLGSVVSSPVSAGSASVLFAIPAGTVAGSYTVTAQYSDTAGPGGLYLPSSGTGTLTIGKGSPTVYAWPTASAISYGQTLASSTLTGGTASVPGTFTFAFPTTAPAVGTASQTVVFTPTDATDYNTVTGTVGVMVNTGTVTITAWPSASSITYGQTLASSALSGGTASVAGTFAFTTPTTAPAVGTALQSVTFTPTDSTDYSGTTGSVSVTVNKATPTVSVWPTASAISYGQTLASSSLNGGTASVPGTFAFTAPSTLPGAGTASQSVTFTPTDAANYNTVSGSVVVTVNKATATVTNWPTASVISYGQTLASSTLVGGTASVSGTFAFTTPATAPPAGTASQSVTFTPTDTTDYDTVTGLVSVTVNKATATVTLGNLSQTYTGSPLSATATTTPAGLTVNFTYNGSSTAPTAVGSYSVVGTVSNANYTGSASATLVIGKAGLTLGAQASPASTVYGAGVTFMGTVAPAITEAAAASFNFVIDAGTANAVTLPTASYQSGMASAVDAALKAGAHTVTLSFSGSADYAAANSASFAFSIGQASPTIVWAPATSLSYGTSLAGLLNASASASGQAVSGTWSYTVQPAGGAVVAVNASTVLGAGSYTLTASFTPADSVDYRAVSSSSSLNVMGNTLTVSANDATRIYGTPNPTFSGSMSGAVNGDNFTESYTTSATASSNAGKYLIVPSASGTDLGDYTVVVREGTLTVTQAGTTTSLSASASSVNPGASVTLSAIVVSATTGTPTGTVKFYDGSTLLGSATLSGGSVNYSTTALSAGVTNSVTAVYSGDINFTSSSTTASTPVTVAPLDFTLTAGPASQAGAAGGSFNYQLTVDPTYGSYAGTVNFVASGLPGGATATFSPSSLAANAGKQTVSMTIHTSATSAAVQQPAVGRKLRTMALAFLLLPLFGARSLRRQGRRLGGFICLLLLALAGTAATATLTGCGAQYNDVNPQQSYTLTVTATSGSMQHASTVTLELH